MTDDLRTRIAVALADTLAADGGVVKIQYGAGETSNIVVNCNPLADAVIRELGLAQEWSIGDDHDGRFIWDDRQEAVEYQHRNNESVQTRHVTDWTADE